MGRLHQLLISGLYLASLLVDLINRKQAGQRGIRQLVIRKTRPCSVALRLYLVSVQDLG